MRSYQYRISRPPPEPSICYAYADRLIAKFPAGWNWLKYCRRPKFPTPRHTHPIPTKTKDGATRPALTPASTNPIPQDRHVNTNQYTASLITPSAPPKKEKFYRNIVIVLHPYPFFDFFTYSVTYRTFRPIIPKTSSSHEKINAYLYVPFISPTSPTNLKSLLNHISLQILFY